MIYSLETVFFCYLFNYFYLFLDKNLESFRSVSPAHKKWYVVSNILKGIILGLNTPNCLYILFYSLYDWNNNLALHLGCIYASIDLASIIIVKKNG